MWSTEINTQNENKNIEIEEGVPLRFGTSESGDMQLAHAARPARLVKAWIWEDW